LGKNSFVDTSFRTWSKPMIQYALGGIKLHMCHVIRWF